MNYEPAPDGYRDQMRMNDTGLVCETCGSVVARRDAGTHTAWHETLVTVEDVERAGRRLRYTQ